jgi:L-fuculose-phosphate aldolase
MATNFRIDPAASGARQQVADAARELARGGLVTGTSGNVSMRFTGKAGDHVAISPTGAQLADLTAEEVAIVDLNGTHVDGPLAPSSELDLHLETYRRLGSGAVVHSHAPAATAIACVLDELPCVHYEMLLLGGPVPVAPYRTFGTPELATVTVDALEGRAATLMANHGTLTHGHDMPTAVRATELLEWASALYLRAASIGQPRALDEAQRQQVVEAAVSRQYGKTQAVAS